METHASPPSSSFLNRLAKTCAIITGGIALIATVGGLLDWRALAGFGAEYIPMAPSTALSFLLFSSAMFFCARSIIGRYGRWFAVSAAGLVSIMTLLMLIQSFFALDLGLEQLLSRTSDTFGMVPMWRMSPFTALIFLLSGLSLLCHLAPFPRWRPLRDTASGLAIGVIAGGLIVGFGYWYQTPLLYGHEVIPIALPTVIAFFFLGSGLLAMSGTLVGSFRDHVPVVLALGLGISLSIAVVVFLQRVQQTHTHFEPYLLITGLLLTTLFGTYLLTSVRQTAETRETSEKLRIALEESQRRAAETSALLDGARAVLDYQKFQNAIRVVFDVCKNLNGATAGYGVLRSPGGADNEKSCSLIPTAFLVLPARTFPFLCESFAEKCTVRAKQYTIMISPTANGIAFGPKGT